MTKNKEIQFNVLDRQYNLFAEEYNQAAIRVLQSSWYILGQEVLAFEDVFSSFNNRRFCIGMNSGLDSLILALRALEIGLGDEVIIPANTYIATVLAITENRATPVFIEPNTYYNIDTEMIEEAITKKTKAILPVHLYGQACEMNRISEIAQRYGLYVIEDCAQSHGACYNNQITGSFGDIGCFSFYPTKNLGAFGDAGAIVTDNQVLVDKLRMLRNYGSHIKYVNEIEGVNSRLDEIQAALLHVKLKHLQELTNDRKSIAQRYLSEINNNAIIMPKTALKADHVYHLFVIRCEKRNSLQEYLLSKGIKTQIHYPIPPHLAKCYKRLGYKQGDFPITESYATQCLSIPLYNGMLADEIQYVIDCINKF